MTVGGFVEDEDLGLPGERAGQPRSPLHAEREAARTPIEVDVVLSDDGAEGLGLDGDRGVAHGLSG
jgi:hypothetical protein